MDRTQIIRMYMTIIDQFYNFFKNDNSYFL